MINTLVAYKTTPWRRALLLTALSLMLVISGCSENEDELEGTCEWFRHCGSAGSLSCGNCDDGDPCTDDRCLFDYTCGHLPRPNCPCVGTCEGPSSGRLHLVQTLRRGTGGYPGPVDPRASVATDDEVHLYVASSGDGTIVQLVRTKAGLRWAESIPLGSFVSLALASDESALYAGSKDELRVATRASDTGRLTVLPKIYPGAVVLASDHGLVAAMADSTLTLYESAPGGLLKKRAELTDPSFLGALSVAWSADGSILFVAGYEANAVSSVNVTDTGLAVIETLTDKLGLNRPAALAASPDGRRLYVAGFCDHAVAIVDVTGGGLQYIGALEHVDLGGFGCDVYRGFGLEGIVAEDLSTFGPLYPSALTLTSDGQYLAVGMKAVWYEVYVYQLADDDLKLAGKLVAESNIEDYSDESFHLAPTDKPDPFLEEPEKFPSTITLKHGKERIYATSRFNNTIVAVSVDANSQSKVLEDALEWFMDPVVDEDKGNWEEDEQSADFHDLVGNVEVVQRGDGGIGKISGAYHVDLSPDGRFAYVAARITGELGVFEIDPDTGGMTEVISPPMENPLVDEHTLNGIDGVRVTPDGTQVLAVDASSGLMLVYDRNSENGSLIMVDAVQVPSCDGFQAMLVDVSIAPDGAAVYTADYQEEGSSCLTAWLRSPDGSLSDPKQYKEAHLAGIESSLFTDDGEHLYVASLDAGSVSHYRRKPGSHELTFMSVVKSSATSGVEFLRFSPDQRTVYVSSPADNQLVVMRRDENGDLTIIQNLTTKDAPLRGASGIAVSSDGSTVYVGAREDNALNIFSADSDGLLTLEHTVGDLEGLRWVNGVRLTPDGRFVVTVAVESSAISVFRVLHGDDDGCGGTCLR